MIVAISFFASFQLKATIDPLKEVKLRPNELMRVVRLGGKADYGILRNVLILKKDGTVIDKAWNKTLTMKLNKAQWEDFHSNLEYFPQNWPAIEKIPKEEMRTDRTEFYLEVRYKKTIKRWNSVGRKEPWPFPLFDTTDVWEYLLKNP
jgi:hypothetical protein